LQIFEKKSLSRVSRLPYHHRTIGRSRTKNIPWAQPPTGYRWGARAPPKCHFCTLQFAFSRNWLDEFSTYLPHRFFVHGGIFCDIRNGGSFGRNTPKIGPKKIRDFSPQILTPLECPHKKFASYRILQRLRPLPPGEESVRISAPNPEIGVPKDFVTCHFWGSITRNRKMLHFVCMDPETPKRMLLHCLKIGSSKFFRSRHIGQKPTPNFWPVLAHGGHFGAA